MPGALSRCVRRLTPPLLARFRLRGGGRNRRDDSRPQENRGGNAGAGISIRPAFDHLNRVATQLSRVPMRGLPIQSNSPGPVLALHAMIAEHLQEQDPSRATKRLNWSKLLLKNRNFYFRHGDAASVLLQLE